MKKNRIRFLFVLLLCIALALGTTVSAVGSAVTISTGHPKGLTQFGLSTEPLNKGNFPDCSAFTLKNGPTVKDLIFEYTYTVPAGTKSVTISFTSSDAENGFFVERKNGTISYAEFTNLQKKPEDCITERTVVLENGKGSTECILPYLPGSKSGSTVRSWTLNNGKIYKFHFIEADDSVSITGNLPERVVYKLNETVEPLSITVAASTDNIEYTWYQGATPETVSTVISGANTSTYTPETTSVGVTYYRVEAKVTETDKEPVTLRSTTTKFVVKKTDVAFSLQTYITRELQPLEDCDEGIYTLKQKLNGQVDEYLLYLSMGKLTGTIPDNVTIERIWSGSAADELNLNQEGALTVDYDTNTFVIDLTKAQSRESALLANNITSYRSYQHLLGRCLYLQTDDGKVYTIAMDSESCNESHKNYLPETVELVGADGIALEGFQIQVPAGGTPTGSVYQKTLTSSTSAVLRARVKNRGDLVGQQVTDTTRYNTWKQTQENWVLVNGQPVGGSFHGQTDVADGTSDAFTLKQGWNVVEVYTNFAPYHLFNDLSLVSSGMHAKRFAVAGGETYYLKSVIETSVVYLIYYEGAAATNVQQTSRTDTSLQEVQALRLGVTKASIASCPLRKTDDGYELTVPQTFDTNVGERTSNNEYTHAVLMAATPKVPGATATFSGVDGLVVGESVADGAFLNMEALYDKDKSFTITVTAADGTTTATYPVRVVYASSVTTPQITVSGSAKLDADFNENVYTYYLDYSDQQAANGDLSISLPTGAKATVNGGEAFTGTKNIKVDPKVDFYRLTITAADDATEASYYFVTRYTKNRTIPYATISQESKDLAKSMLWKYYETLNDTEYFSDYWNIFRAKAATGAEGVEAYNFDNKYVMHPAWHKMNYTTDWAACIMEIVMLGYNPYNFPYYGGSEPDEHFNYVGALETADSSAFASSIWYQFARKAVGDPASGKMSAEKGFALNKDYSWLDIRAWAIASLAGCETKDMVRYVDTLHNEQVTNSSSEFKSLWDNSRGIGDGTNPNTVGCVLSAIAAAGADPDKQFVYDGAKPLETIRETMYREDGLFYSGKNSTQTGELSKDIVIGLGDVMHGSNVWDRYALTAEKYNALIEKANTEGISTTNMPPFAENDEASSKAYFALYQQVADAREKKGDTSMRAKVIWGMPYEVFADAVKAMPEASALTANDLAKLEELIVQYEAMDDSSRKAVASDVLAKYQALVKRGLELKHDTASTKQASSTYQDILDLPTPDKVTEDNKDATKAKVEAIRKDIEAMTDNEKQLLTWAGASVLGKLKAVEKELKDPTEKITVTFTLLGDHVHTKTETDVHTLKNNNLETWIKTANYDVKPDTTVWEFVQGVLYENKITYTTTGGGDSLYVDTVTRGDVTIGGQTNGANSGWLYTVNGVHPSVGIAATTLSDGDAVIFHYTDDYTIDKNGGSVTPPDPEPGDKFTDKQISDAYKATGNALALVDATTGSTGGEWLMLGLARAEHTIDSSSKDAYLRSVRSYINKNYSNGKLSDRFSTENSRIILALTALGEDPQTFVADKNLLEGYSDFDWTVQQGVAGPIFALLAIDSQKYTIPDYANIRNDLMKEILDAQRKGSWSAHGTTPDVDMTAMAIQALAPYYKTNSDVKDAVDTAISYLFLQQNDATGAFPNADGELTAESTAQVIVALTSLGKNPATEKRFQAGDKKLSPIDGLMRFYKGNGKFSHKLDADANDMATEQSYYALVSYYRLKNGKTSLYDMTDLKDNTPESVASVIAKIDAIGSVTEDSYEDIIAAREAYKKLSNADKAQLPDGYLEILENAEKEYAELLANKKTDAKKELNDYYLGIDQKDYGEAGRKKLSEILAKAQRDITSAKSCPQVDSILRQAISDLDAVRKGDITVSFRLIGSLEATQDVNLTTDSYLPEYVTWIPTTKYELASNATVYDLFTEALRDAGLSAIGAEGGYVKTIYAPSCLGGYALSEFSNGKRSGWMYTLNGKHSSNALTDQKLEDGDMVVWHYVNDYSHEVSDWSGDSQHPSLGNGTYYNGWLRAADISPEQYVQQLLGKILTVGAHGTVEPKLTLSHLGKSVTFTFKPDKGYRVKDVKVDGKSVGPVASYTVDKLSVSTRIEVTFTNGKLPFTDVRESDWFYDDVVFAYENGLFSGTSDTTFSPNTSMTRAMLVTVLYRLEGQPTVNGRSGFSDVTFNSYYEDAVTWAADNGIVNGISASTFSPNANVTREQMAAILYRYAQYKKYNTAASSSLNSFSDHASVSGYAVTPLQWAVAEKLINGSAGKLMPTGNATRAQVAAILHRFVTNVAK